MKKTLFSVAVAMMASASLMIAGAQVSRQDAPSVMRASELRASGVKLSPEMMGKLRANVVDDAAPLHPGLRSVSAPAVSPRRVTNKGAAGPQLKAAAKATDIQGYCIYSPSSGEVGWYKVSWPVSAFQWGRQSEFSPACGFVRDGELFSFYTRSTTTSGLTDAGLMVQDVTTGEVKETVPFQIFDTLEQVTFFAAYDPAGDTAYLVTSDALGSGFQLQKFNPATRSFSALGVPVAGDCLDMAWNPADNSLYILSESGAMRKYDSKGKKFNQVTAYSYDMTDYPNDMVYSPKDDAFFAMLDSYDDEDNPCTDAVLLSLNGTVTYLGTLDTNKQFSILHISDSYVNADGVKAPVFKGWNVDGAATSGSFTVTLPGEYENGKGITGTVYLTVTVDGQPVAGSFRGAAGTDVNVSFTSDEGLHRFKVTPYLLGDDGREEGTPLQLTRYLGYDTPEAPANVVLTDTKVTWKASVNGANDGYINSSEVTYDVYIDGIKMNDAPVTATSLDVVIPANGALSHRAEVYAKAGGKTSEAGVSGKIYADGALSLPVYIAPEAGATDLDEEVIAMFTTVRDPLNTEPLRGWRYDDQMEHTGGFYCLAPNETSGETCDEWLFLPAISFPDADAHYKFSMDVWSGNHYFTADETYEVVIAQRPTGKKGTVIRPASVVYKQPYFETSEAIFQVPEAGEWYIGIHYISPVGSYRLYTRNYKVEKAKSSADSPAAVTDIEAVAADRGQLKATVSFNMPVMSVSGSALGADVVITAKASTEAGAATVTGKPGERVSVDVPTRQGDNTVRIATSSEAGDGLSTQTVVYTGVYRPGKAIIDTKVSDDNQRLTINVELDEYNDNDEWTGPDECDVTIYRKVGDEWRVAAEIGKNRVYDFVCPQPDTQDMYVFGVAAKNSVGFAEEMTTFGVHLGKLFSLPMKESFPASGAGVSITYEPISLEHISYYPAEWGFCDPTEVDQSAANASGVALYATWEAESQALLPRFTTKGMNNVKVDLSMFFGNHSPALVTVFASSPALDMEPVANFTRESGKGWEHKLVSLPAAFQNAGWVQLTLRVKMEGYSQFFLLDSYSIADYPADMMTIDGIEGPSRTTVGETVNYTVTIENAGTSAAAVPAHSFKVLGDNGVIADLTATDAPATIEAGKKAELTFSFTTKAADKGDALVRFNLQGQPAAAVTEVEKQLMVLNAQIPVVSDLAANVKENNVTLTWSAPMYTETFEAHEPWSYAENLRGFRNLDLDGKNVWGMREIDYEGKAFAKAYQVFSTTVTDNPIVAAHSGEQYLLGMSASKGETSDWLISPQVKGASKLAFWMNILDAGYPETLLVKYSRTGNQPDDFVDLDGGYICPENTGWTRYEFTLPADARYFALHHVGDEGQEQFGLMLDDIAFEPAEGGLAPESYNLYRDDELIASGLTQPGYVDLDADLSSPVRYYVKSVSTVNGESVESDRSNVVWTTEYAGVDNVISDGSKSITGLYGMIAINGFEAGERYSVADGAGRTVAAGAVSGASVKVAILPGVYVVKVGATVAKVVVR